MNYTRTILAAATWLLMLPPLSGATTAVDPGLKAFASGLAAQSAGLNSVMKFFADEAKVIAYITKGVQEIYTQQKVSLMDSDTYPRHMSSNEWQALNYCVNGKGSPTQALMLIRSKKIMPEKDFYSQKTNPGLPTLLENLANQIGLLATILTNAQTANDSNTAAIVAYAQKFIAVVQSQITLIRLGALL